MKPTKTLLISPPYYSFRGVLPIPACHLGLLYLSSYLRRNDFDSKIFMSDLHTGLEEKLFVSDRDFFKYASRYREYVEGDRYHPIWDRIKSTILEYQPDIVGITTTTPEQDLAYRISSVIKGIDSEIRVVFGGTHSTFMPDDVLKRDCVDFVIRGEGEIPLLRLVSEIDRGSRNWSKVPSLSFKENGTVIHNKRCSLHDDLDELPPPAWENLLLPENYTLKHRSVIASRGCPYSCSFCSDKRYWGRSRTRSPQKVVEEIEGIVGKFQDTEEIYFIDGSLTHNRRFVDELCSGLVSRGLRLKYYCTARFDSINESMLASLKEAGFYALFLGAESGDDEVLRSMKKKIDAETIVKKVDLIKRSGIGTMVSILVGVPNESERSLKKTIDLMKRLNADTFDVCCYLPMPGSRWYDELPTDIRDGVSWLDFSYKGGYPYLFSRQGKEALNKYIDEMYRRSDMRLLKTRALLFVYNVVKGAAKKWRSILNALHETNTDNRRNQ